MHEQTYSVNGTHLYTFLNPHAHSFCLTVYVRAGSLYETEENNGITHLYEHVVFRNLKKKYNGKLYELLAEHGLYFSARTYKEFMSFNVDGPPGEFDFAAEIICGVLDEINIPLSELNAEKLRIKAEMREDDERNTVRYLYNRSAWQDTNNDREIIGYCRVLDRISIKKLNQYRGEMFSKNNVFFYATGHVSEDELDGLKQRMEGLSINPADFGRRNEIHLSPQFFHRDGNISVRNDYWTYMQIGFDVDAPRYSGGVHDLLYSILFKGDKALIHNDLSEEEPLIYSFDGTYEEYDNVSNLYFKFEIRPDQVQQAAQRVVNVLNRVKNGDFNFLAHLRCELSDVKVRLDDQYNLNWHMAYNGHILKTEPFDYTREDYGRYRDVTKEKIMQAAQEIFRKENLTVVMRGPKRRIKTEPIERIFDQLG